MASGDCPDNQFRCGRGIANPIPTRTEIPSDPPAGDDGPGFVTSLLCALAVLLYRTCHHARRSNGERLARSGIGNPGVSRHVADRADLLQEVFRCRRRTGGKQAGRPVRRLTRESGTRISGGLRCRKSEPLSRASLKLAGILEECGLSGSLAAWAGWQC